MTYASYIDRLKADLSGQDKQLIITRDLLRGKKGYLTLKELKLYQSLVHEFIIIRVECDELLNWISANRIDLHTEMKEPSKN